MSSEGSVSTSTSSRIRQFGLYRTIDARTEEFLRLSRKRQIKQGCACAAISTAITVTVVITVFFVYMEYGMNTDANQQSIGKAGWIGLLNDSLASSFEEKFSKSKINFDRNTIKLLPILIKALKQNRYLEKIIEDYSSSSPSYDGKVTTEFSFKKDIFLNTKSWMKKPSLYTIEYKTSPIVFLKNPTREPGYYTKNRKIRDYKRIMEYVAKMINDKNGIGSTIPMTNNKPEAQTESIIKPQVTSKSIQEINFNKKYRNLKKKSSKKKTQKAKHGDIVGCKCPKQLSIILDKILSSIQQLLPDDKISNFVPCSGDQKTNTPEPNPDIAFYPPKTKLITTTSRTTLNSNEKSLTATKEQSIPVQFSEFDNIYHKEETTTLPEDTSTQRLPYLNHIKLLEPNRPENTNKYNNEDTTVQSIYLSTQTSRLPFLENKNVIQPNELKTLPALWGSQIADPEVHLPTTIVYDHIEPTEGYYDTTITTHPIPSTVDIMERQQNYTTPTTENNLLLESEEANTTENETAQSNYINGIMGKTTQNLNLNFDTINLRNIMQNENNKYDHMVDDNTDDVLDEMNEFNIRSFELLKSKLLLPNKRLNSTVKYPVSSIVQDVYSTTESSNEDSITTLSTTKPSTSTQTYVYGYVSKTVQNKESAETNKIPKLITPFIKINENTTSNSTENILSILDKNKQDPFYLGLDNNALEDEIEKITHDDEYQEELNNKRVESRTQPTSLKNSTNKSEESIGTDFWHILKNNERFYGKNSMLPQSRPTYLEIHRNGWKPEENNKDYDTDMKYNIFDLL